MDPNVLLAAAMVSVVAMVWPHWGTIGATMVWAHIGPMVIVGIGWAHNRWGVRVHHHGAIDRVSWAHINSRFTDGGACHKASKGGYA